ncbi:MULTISPECIES: c-type cytochrome [Oceanimonas]|uniref:Cytochrome c4 n=1 Tax=Oceanimonas doudoroffii TaxID=84158 RepID=A0A233RC27_9GAMM|nr:MULTISPECIES: c-type cytochrome [Oceanimonas]NHI01029.1 Cytochrome c4 [Oceanimonas sp. MB9]OXY80943.1 cytochrome c4 [Oceanimonas doudoroffii]
MTKTILLGALLSATAAPALAEMPPQAAVCISCHQASGLGMANLAPSIAGMPVPYLAEQLRHFQSGARDNAIMKPMAMMLDDAGVEAVSQWFASLPVSLPERPAFRGEKPAPQNMATGERLAYQGDWQRDIPSCVSCHGPEGVGAGEAFPRLAGQHADYIEGQLKAWQSGSRAPDTHGLMAPIAKRLSAEDISAVASYFASLGGQ